MKLSERLPKWRNFAKSGLTATSESRTNSLGKSVLKVVKFFKEMELASVDECCSKYGIIFKKNRLAPRFKNYRSIIFSNNFLLNCFKNR